MTGTLTGWGGKVWDQDGRAQVTAVFLIYPRDEESHWGGDPDSWDTQEPGRSFIKLSQLSGTPIPSPPYPLHSKALPNTSGTYICTKQIDTSFKLWGPCCHPLGLGGVPDGAMSVTVMVTVMGSLCYGLSTEGGSISFRGCQPEVPDPI